MANIVYTDEQLFSLPTSSWGSPHYDLLNVEDVFQDIRVMIPAAPCSDRALRAVLRPLQKDARKLTSTEVQKQGHYLLQQFYTKVKRLTAIDIEDDDEVLRTARRNPRRANGPRIYHGSLPRPTSAQSDSSTSSEDHSSSEKRSLNAFQMLTSYVLSHHKAVSRLVFEDAEWTTKIVVLPQTNKFANCRNDGSICATAHPMISPKIPWVNIEAKSRDGCASANAVETILAQEVGEMLGIALARYESFGTVELTMPEHMRTVFSFAVHHRRVYLVKIVFDNTYLRACQAGRLLHHGHVLRVVRSTQSYRLDNNAELKVLVEVMYRLFSWLESACLL